MNAGARTTINFTWETCFPMLSVIFLGFVLGFQGFL